MTKSVSNTRKFWDALYVGVLIVYVLAGVRLTPFHGDESTIIHMSADWYTLTHDWEVSKVFWVQNVQAGLPAQEQEWRILNGTISKFVIGLAGSIAGLQRSDLNGPWVWGHSWSENLQWGTVPSDRLLFIARLSSAWLLTLSIAVVFAVANRIGGRGAAWISTGVYTTLPSVLLNGRRAVFESAMLLGMALVILAALELARVIRWQATTPSARRLALSWLLFGVASGFATASKHTNLVVIGAAALYLTALEWRHLLRLARYGLLAIFAGLTTFLLLNPTWWSAPTRVPENVILMRQLVLEQQAAFNTTFASPSQRLAALVEFPFGAPQYFEDKDGDWSNWIGPQIEAYERTGLAGLNWQAFGVVPYLLLVIGFAAAILKKSYQSWMLAGMSVIIALTIFRTNDLVWQRYYLPLAIPWSFISGVGLAALAHYVSIRLKCREKLLGGRSVAA